MSAQRTWSRVEDPKTARGHGLEATIGGDRWYAWENPDGSWSLSVNGNAPVKKRDWADVRATAERDRAQNPMHPMVAGAAATGMAIAMRDHLIHNPGPAPSGDFRCDSEMALLGILGQVGLAGTQYLARRPKCDKFGNVWMMVRPGFGRAARRAVRRARLPFPVKIMESTR